MPVILLNMKMTKMVIEELKECIVVKTILTFEGNWSQFDDDMEVEVPSFDVFWVFLDH